MKARIADVLDPLLWNFDACIDSKRMCEGHVDVYLDDSLLQRVSSSLQQTSRL